MNQVQAAEVLNKIIQERLITIYFQPIYDLTSAKIFGYEALTRGPESSPLFYPDVLFDIANKQGCLNELELLCRECALSRFTELNLNSRLFLNVSASLLSSPDHQKGMTLAILNSLGMSQEDIVIELSEKHPYDHNGVSRKSVEHYRQMGFPVAIDDLGVGYSGLQLWSELQPDIVKIDQHFIRDLDKDHIKLEFVRSILTIARRLRCTLIAEGIETQSELDLLMDLGVTYGQGYFLGKPTAAPVFTDHPYLQQKAIQRSKLSPDHNETVHSLVRPTPTINFNSELIEVSQIFKNNSGVYSIPVLKNEKPIGVIRRHQLHELFSTTYGRALYEHKLATFLLSDDVIVVDSSVSLSSVSTLMTDREADILNNEIIVTKSGKYLGIGYLRDLLKRITDLKIQNATNLNPLTLLPGNVQINNEIQKRLSNKEDFRVAYFDLNDFKPFNDCFGYSLGDEVIQLVGNLIKEQVELPTNFIGHIGGDDFIVVFSQSNWQQQCQWILDSFSEKVRYFYDDIILNAGGVWTETRQGDMKFHSILSLSVGVISITGDQDINHHQVAELSTLAKKSAKKTGGNSLYIQPLKQHKNLI